MATDRIGKAACQTCRARHYECDKTKPTCQRCKDNGRLCVPAFNVRFRRKRNVLAADSGLHVKGKLTFDEDQSWVKTPSILSFVDETPRAGKEPEPEPEPVSSEDDQSYDGSPIQASQFLTPASDGFQYDPHAAEHIVAHATPTTLEVSGNNISRGSSSAVRIEDLLCKNATLPTSPVSLPCNLSSPVSTPRRGSLYIDQSQSNIITPRHAELLHHFKTAIGPLWFDVPDADFTREALLLAPTCPLLLYSMLATSAIHENRFSTDKTVADNLAMEADFYHKQCVSILLPIVRDNKDSITDGTFLACSTILRFYEEISAPVHGKDKARHLLGGYASVAERGQHWTGLSNAAFWIHQRQDAYFALVNQRVPNTDLTRSGLDRSNAPAPEHIWAKRATCLNADVVEHCFGPDMGSAQKYRELMQRLEDWDFYKPETFTPVCYKERDPASGRHFPNIYLLMDTCTFGLSYHYFSMLLMTICNPTIPKIGSMYLEGRKRTEENALHYIRVLCGLACSNPVPPGRVISCLAVAQCGVWVKDPMEQRAILDMLELIDRQDAWPKSITEKPLEDQWA